MPHKRAPNATKPHQNGGGQKRRLSRLRWRRRETTKEGRNLSPLLPKVTSSVIIREAVEPEIITIDDSPPPTPMDWKTFQEATTPGPPYTSPPYNLVAEETTPHSAPLPYPFPPPTTNFQSPQTLIPPWPGAVEILDTRSATRVPDHTELTPEFLRWFDDLYQGGQDLSVILENSQYFQDLSYSYPP